jgi:hypothetical protein
VATLVAAVLPDRPLVLVGMVVSMAVEADGAGMAQAVQTQALVVLAVPVAVVLRGLLQ